MKHITRHNAILIILCSLFLVSGFLSVNEMLIYTPDSARYLIWAGSLAHGDGYRDATRPEPSRYVVHAPLYPLLLVPSAWIAPGSVAAAKAATVLLGLALLALVVAWIRRIVGPREALIGALLLAVNPLMMVYSTQVLSDVPFALCVVAFFMLTERLAFSTGKGGWEEVLLVAVVVAGIFLREVGLTLMLGGTGYFVYRKQYRRALLILLVSLLFYSVWFVRNEILIAAVENPPIRNTRVFFTHFYTARETSLFVELGTRLMTNLQVYSRVLGRLVLYPDFTSRQIGVISLSDPAVAAIVRIMPVAQYVLATVTIGLGALGVWTAAKQWKGFPIAVVFLICYMGPILFYPVNDIRFLFPILLLMIVCITFGLRAFAARVPSRSMRSAFAAVGLFCLLPNIVWVENYVRNSSDYRGITEATAASYDEEPNRPDQFGKPLHLAAKWFAQRGDSTTVVLSRWKELGYWLNGPRVLDTDPNITPESFDLLIRNYDAKYLVSLASRGGLREHEALFTQSLRYRFRTVHHIGNVDILEVLPRDAYHREPIEERTRVDSIRLQYAAALELLDGGDPQAAETLLTRLTRRIGKYGGLMFHIGVAREFAGKLDDASVVFAGFRSVQQAGSYIQQGWYHQEMIARLKAAERESDPTIRADRLHVVAINYWEVGFRREALRMLERALRSDSSFYPAWIFSSIFRYKLGNRSRAWSDFEQARTLAPENILTQAFGDVLAISDTLDERLGSVRTVALLHRRAAALNAMGLQENVIDDLRAILKIDQNDRDALRLLADRYYIKEHMEPAYRMYARLEACGGLDQTSRLRIEELRKRLN